MKQLETFAKTTRTALAYLFLAVPPDESLPVPDYRALPSGPPDPLAFLRLLKSGAGIAVGKAAPMLAAYWGEALTGLVRAVAPADTICSGRDVDFSKLCLSDIVSLEFQRSLAFRNDSLVHSAETVTAPHEVAS